MSYKSFYKTFLAEMPQRLNGGNDFEAQLEMVRENLKYNPDVETVAPGVFKTQNDTQTTYWVGDASATDVSLIVDTSSQGNYQKVEYTSKNPRIPTGTPPFVSDLYILIKQDASNNNLVFTSDEFLSDGGEKLWKTLVSKGYHVGVYDTTAHKYALTKVNTPAELSNYLGDADRRKYIFVLSESIQHIRGVIHSFNLMEMKRLSGYPLFENFKKR